MDPDREARTLESLGLSLAPRDHPLLYPGVWPTASGLLDGDLFLPLDRLSHPGRTPVLAVGSNASPAQLRRKMAGVGPGSRIPMTRARVTGVGVGVSAHVSLHGYVSASPFDAPGVTKSLFVIWLDDLQLAAVDATEPHFDRVALPAPAFRVELEDGGTLPEVFSYVNRHGVLRDGTGTPRGHPGQRPLITELLAGSPEFRRVFGSSPEEFCARARADATLCEHGTRLLAREGLVTDSGLERLR